ncbi:hypothetical protein JYP49_14085 [Nitratireductor aquimarinus]|uniref:hypothetical protein n=1 Tax=Nitratireductor TaxID=245876 RepID=UPI0019D3C19F|nr:MULTISPECIES: hypothetical protein [Nitratireductor]MBN7763838.1 hypothetical protein [Nitratireductor aquibiodomus]MBN7777726.1 hypothetical protein [Nitratireductor pacificus]MBN7781720.1 hypothetical protein [Nitratireductor pacificus]MBN7790526.1 hypothetical protein [Nitratireductor aquimarinus]MBY6099936.1 hypothetical protein [Nitratireductor aquimarinus]
MTARDIIAALCYKPVTLNTVPLGRPAADLILSALTSSGYRILAPGEVDRETLEAAAKVADRGVPIGDKDSKVECFSCNHEVIAAAIRALGGGEG